MSNGKDMIIHLMAGLIKKRLNQINAIPLYKNEAILNRMNHLVEILILKLIGLIMQQKQISKIFHILILQVLY